MNKSGSIQKTIFYSSISVVLLVLATMGIGLYGLFMGDNAMDNLFDLNETTVGIVEITTHFEGFEKNIENYFIITDDGNRLSALEELAATTRLLEQMKVPGQLQPALKEAEQSCHTLARLLDRLFNQKNPPNHPAGE